MFSGGNCFFKFIYLLDPVSRHLNRSIFFKKNTIFQISQYILDNCYEPLMFYLT